MPATPVPPEVDRFLREPNPAVMASLRPGGGPHTVATWYDWEDGRVLISLDDSRLRLRFLERDPRVSLTVLHPEDWYRHVSLIGEVEELRPDEGLADIDRLSTRYRGAPYRNRTSPRTSAWIRVDRWHGWVGSRALREDEPV
jgi:PPOX class probable F420-dependent enzyme